MTMHDQKSVRKYTRINDTFPVFQLKELPRCVNVFPNTTIQHNKAQPDSIFNPIVKNRAKLIAGRTCVSWPWDESISISLLAMTVISHIITALCLGVSMLNLRLNALILTQIRFHTFVRPLTLQTNRTVGYKLPINQKFSPPYFAA